MKKRILIPISIAVILLLAGSGYYLYRSLYSDNVKLQKGEVVFLHLSDGTTFDECVDSLRNRNLLNDYWSFRQLGHYLSLDERTITGRYRIEADMSNLQLLRRLRSGHQAPVDVLIRPVRSTEALFEQLARQLESSDSVFRQTLDTIISRNQQLDRYNILSRFIPNTYQMYWNANPEQVFKRLFSEHDNFWKQNNRLQRANELGLTPTEVYTLASIVERETNVSSEKSTIAGVYLNRLERNMPLQADPTVVYAHGDFSLKRVLHKHLEIDSPYNTYKYAGLPPGPIGMASIESIDAVFNAPEHDFLYFCAKAGGKGEHVFATNLQGHLRNARKFHRWLNEQERLSERK